MKPHLWVKHVSLRMCLLLIHMVIRPYLELIALLLKLVLLFRKCSAPRLGAQQSSLHNCELLLPRVRMRYLMMFILMATEDLVSFVLRPVRLSNEHVQAGQAETRCPHR